MPALSTAPTSARNTWTCPTCRHGSPDPRDEVAHLDAHRQLGQFLREWDAAVVSDRRKQRGRRPVALVLGASAVVVAVVVTALVSWGLNGTGGSARPATRPVPGGVAAAPAQPQPAPTVEPAPSPEQAQAPTTAPGAAETAPSTPQPASPSSPVVRPRAAVAPSPPVPANSADPSSSVDAPPASSATIGTSASKEPTAGPRLAAPTYLLKVCLFATCLSVP